MWLGLLAKFLVLFIFLFLLLSRTDRFWLRRKEPYLALGFALLVFTPCLLWNAWNHSPSACGLLGPGSKHGRAFGLWDDWLHRKDVW
ncbi:MAG: hypothetical protein GX493_05245 [Firmicutes bacterium]|nr:hypothetical protein [Bacillota bacterium]